MAGRWSTHDIELGDGVVTKRFRAHGRDEHRREWRALPLLAEHAPGLAPAPIRADLDADPPVIVMSRLPGEPLRGARLTSAQVAALADAVTSMHAAVPPARVAELPEAAWTAGRAAALLESYYREGSWRRLGGVEGDQAETGVS
ncbi:phosphotransferase [Nonomuraea pusilla]|uniref:phosphotransferase n=1 Tax=Nonomuraea pusilla TaxID=46177 RepID=UPI0033248D2E